MVVGPAAVFANRMFTATGGQSTNIVLIMHPVAFHGKQLWELLSEFGYNFYLTTNL